MALVVGTNSYVDVTSADAYFSERVSTTQWDSLSVEDKEKTLITATRLVDDRSWIGQAVSSSQTLAWPREGAVYRDKKLGLVVIETDIPEKVKLAVYEQALHLTENSGVLSAGGQVFESISVGSISLSDSNSSRSIPKMASSITGILEGLVVRNTVGWWRAN